MKKQKASGTRLERNTRNGNGTYFLSQNHHESSPSQPLNLTGSSGYAGDNKDMGRSEINVQHDIKETLKEAAQQIEEVFVESRYQGKIPIVKVREKIVPAIKKMAHEKYIFQVIHELQAKDHYTYRHSIGVAVISSMIGKWLDLDHKEASLLTIGTILHDIGKVKVPNSILNKPGPLTNEEYEEVKKHTVYGYELIKNTSSLSHRCAFIALQHHERENGMGYPLGLTGEEIDPLSKIAAVADVFHAMTSKRVYHDISPFYQVINQMEEEKFGKFDPVIVNVFINKIMESFVGNQVKLSDDRIATIVKINNSEPSKPLVKWENQFIDLANERQLFMKDIPGS